MLRECEGDNNSGVGRGLGMGHEYVGGSCIVFSTADVLGMSRLCGMTAVGGVCEMCMCFAQAVMW